MNHPIIEKAVARLCDAYGHEYNRHHHHCFNCGRTTGNHHSWCPDSFTIKSDQGMVGAFQFVGCKECP